MKKKRKLKRPIKIILVIGGLALLFLILFMFRNVLFKKPFEYKEHLNDVVLTVDQTQVSLEEMSYYIAVTEKMIQAMAEKYNPDNPKQFWNAHFSAGKESKFTSDYAKDQAGELAVYYNIMWLEAQNHGLKIDSEMKAECEKLAEDFYTRLDVKGRNNIGLTFEGLCRAIEKQQLSKKYIQALLKAKDGEIADKDLLYDGSFYKSEILPTYKTQFREEIWSKIKLGSLSVNN